ncbi:MAG: N-acetyltransferase [Chloroflexi bacterium]|nr:N-acetyltransferase [Chloroflexota bacterium]
MFGPVLKGEGVTLRPPDETDPERFVVWLADTEVTRYLLRPFAVAIEQEREWFKSTGESKTTVYWIVEAEGRAIGSTGIHDIDWLNANATTGTVIGDRSAWGKGYGSKTMRLRTAYAFEQLNLHKLSSSAFMENEHSKRALQKAGYRETGVEREHLWRDGRWHDHWRCEILRSDWQRSAGRVP